MMKICVVLPAFNEGKVIATVLRRLKQELRRLPLLWEIVVVDDGSKDNTAEEARKSGVKVLRHVLNRGLGGALATGLAYAQRHYADFLLTMDSDGQHDPKDIAQALQFLRQNKADVIIGSRLLERKKMPFDRLLISWAGSILTFLLFGIWTTDSQSGFRIFNRKAIEKIQLKTQGMEVSSEVFAEIKRHKLRTVEVPIDVIYTEYSRQKGQSNLNAPKVMLKLFLRLFR